MSDVTAARAQRAEIRRKGFLWSGLVVVIAALIYAAWWWLAAR